MMKETKKGLGSNKQGEMSEVTSEYNLGSAKLIEVKGAEGEVDGKTLKVTTNYSESISFKIVVKEKGKTAIYIYVHKRDVSLPEGNKTPNDVKPVIKPSKTKYPYVPQPALRELL